MQLFFNWFLFLFWSSVDQNMYLPGYQLVRCLSFWVLFYIFLLTVFFFGGVIKGKGLKRESFKGSSNVKRANTGTGARGHGLGV